MTDENTRKLVSLYRRTGSKKAFDVLLINYRDACYLIANNYYNSKFTLQSRDDLFSNVFDFLILMIERKFDLRKNNMKFLTYLMQYGSLHLVDKDRSFTKFNNFSKTKTTFRFDVDEKGNTVEPISTLDIQKEIEQIDLKEKMEKAIIDLPRTEQVVMACILQGMSLSEIAKQADVSVSRISQIKKAAEAKLRNKLEKFYEME
jgi:RNA polymerase sigma factor (sigma-70 family)